jgi:hypothetical protein
MKKNWKEIALIIVGIAVPMTSEAAAHRIKHAREISVVADRSLLNSVPVTSVSHHTPPAPYNTMTFTITAPVKVCVGQTFAIDYAIDVSKFTHISYWADLIPDDVQGLPIKLIEVIHPTIGIFNSDDVSVAQKGGRGMWVVPKGLPGSTVQHLKILVQAIAPGLIKFASVVATNPPFYIGTAGTLVSCEPPIASPIQVFGFSGQPLEISILDYIVADSELQVTAISSASYGLAQLNEDYTITYTPYMGFYGKDSFTYSVTDAAGNVIHGVVAIIVANSPIPQIIQ